MASTDFFTNLQDSLAFSMILKQYLKFPGKKVWETKKVDQNLTKNSHVNF